MLFVNERNSLIYNEQCIVSSPKLISVYIFNVLFLDGTFLQAPSNFFLTQNEKKSRPHLLS